MQTQYFLLSILGMNGCRNKKKMRRTQAEKIDEFARQYLLTASGLGKLTWSPSATLLPSVNIRVTPFGSRAEKTRVKFLLFDFGCHSKLVYDATQNG